MALYLGDSNRLKVKMNNITYVFYLYSTVVITNGIKLLSSDDYILKDFNGLYLTVKEEN